MKRLLAILAIALSASASAATLTNVTANVDAPAWKRTHIIGLPGGKLVDPTGTLAPYSKMAAITAANDELNHISAEAIASISNQLARLYANTNRIANFSRKMFVQAHLYPDMTGRDNWWSYIPRQWTDGTNDWAWVYFSRDLTVAPVLKRRYRTETSTNVVEGAWVNWSTNNLPMIEGFANCHLIRYERPEDCRMVVVFNNPYVFNGTKEQGFDFGSRTFTIDGEYYYTGAWTNALGKIWSFNNGVKVRGETDVQ